MCYTSKVTRLKTHNIIYINNYKVFRAKYFPNGTIMDDDVKTKGSYAWQGILKARGVVRMGSTWRIGDGKKVMIRGDSWLPPPSSGQVISPLNRFPTNAHVCALMDEEGHHWLEERVTEEFLPHEARAILSIPLSQRRVDDVLIWKETNHGNYTTKSAYKMLWKHATMSKPGPSDPSAHSAFWKEIWSLRVPTKVRHFVWRACTDSLPTKKNLFTRKVTRSPTCDTCRSEVEDTVHALWGCQSLKEIWWEEETCRKHLLEKFASFKDLFLGMKRHEIPNLAELFAMLAWSIWNKRNACRMGQVYLPNSRIFNDAVERLQEYHSVLDEPLSSSVGPILPATQWVPPENPLFKVNYGGALFRDTSTAGISAVVRDHDGHLIGALSERIQLPPSVEDVEALACRRAVTFAAKIGLREVVVEGDSEVIWKHLTSDKLCMAGFGHIIGDIRAAASNFSVCLYSHVCRNGNRVADKLAKKARHLMTPLIWLEDIPCDISPLVLYDRSLLSN